MKRKRAIGLKSDLGSGDSDLMELMQRVNYGWIRGLPVWSGSPVVSSGMRVVRTIKMGGENGPRVERGIDDYRLKREVIEFFNQVARLRNATIDIEVKHGLPFRIDVVEAA